MEGLQIVSDRSKIDINLLLESQPFLPTAAKQVQDAIPFAGVYAGNPVSALLLQKMPKRYDILNLVVAKEFRGKGIGREMIMYALDYVRVHGGRYVETGCGNGDARVFTMVQKMGFRMVGFWPDYFSSASRPVTVIDGIQNRDMLRFRLDLIEDYI